MHRFIFITLTLLFTTALTAHAATLSIAAPSQGVVGEQVSVDVILDAEGIAINSVDMSILYPADTLEFNGYQDAAGVIKLWVAPPKAKVPGVVTFTGGVPGGVDGTYENGGKSGTIPIVRLLFTPMNSGSATVRIDHSLILMNDGKASELSHTKNQRIIEISGSSAAAEAESSADVTAPLPFMLTFIPENDGGMTPAMVAFSAQDERGIARYEMKLGWGRWREAASPAPLPNRWFSYTVKVRATDGAGNERDASMRVKGLFPTSAIVIVCVIVLASVWKLFMVKKKYE